MTRRTPPRIARGLLRRVVHDDSREMIDGDLHELYVHRLDAYGALRANAWYWLETLSFLMRFTLDRIARFFRGFSGDHAPSVLDLKLGARMLAKSPGLAFVGGLGIAVAVALGAGAYAVINSYFYPDIPLHEGDRVIAIGKFDPRRRYEEEHILHDFVTWRRELRSIVDVGAFRTIRRNIVADAGAPEPITIAEMTASGFRVAKIPPLMGRTLIDADELPGAPPVLVIGFDVWQSRFNGDRSIIGRQLRIGTTLHTIVGVMPERFGFPVNHQYWTPLHIDPAVAVAPGGGPGVDVFGRLAPGATKETAQAELATITRRLSAEAPQPLANMESRIVPYSDIFVHAEAEGETSAYAILRFLIAIFLVIVAMNVAVLVYARTVTRTGEIAVRTALGATRSRIVMQLFAEAFVLSGVAALAGLAVVAVGLRMFDAALAGLFEGRPPFWMHSGLSAGTVLYTVGLAVLAALIIGVFPAMRATGARLRAAMGSIGSGAKARLGATWTLLIVVQVAISVAILPLALLKVVEMTQLAMRPAGFAPGEYLSTKFLVERDGTPIGNPTDAVIDSTRRVVNALLAQVAAEPGVAGATITISSPWNGGGNAVVETDLPNAEATTTSVQNVDTNFIHLFDVRMLAGRPFDAGDAALRLRDRPVIVNRSFVDKMLGAGDPLGRRIRYRAYGDDVQPWMRIVGVIDDFPKAVRTPGGQVTRGAAMYHLAVPGDIYDGLLTIRLRGRTPEDFTPTLRRIAMSVDPTLQLSDTRSLDSMYREDTRAAKQLAAVVILVTLSVVLLSAAGIHAMMSFAVNQRRREIGIRSALGAPARLLLTSVLARASRQLTLGVAMGLAAALAADTMSGGMLLSGTRLLLVPATAVFMLMVGIFAAAGPARRGLRVQPTEALQAD